MLVVANASKEMHLNGRGATDQATKMGETFVNRTDTSLHYYLMYALKWVN